MTAIWHLTHSHSHTSAGRIYQLGLHGVRVDMTAAADHFEKASTLGHAGALGESKINNLELARY